MNRVLSIFRRKNYGSNPSEMDMNVVTLRRNHKKSKNKRWKKFSMEEIIKIESKNILNTWNKV